MLKLDLVLKNFNLGDNFQTLTDRDFMLDMCILVTNQDIFLT